MKPIKIYGFNFSNLKLIVTTYVSLILISCSPKGPKTHPSSFIGKTKGELVSVKGMAKTIKVFDKAEAHIYKIREEYFGKKGSFTENKNLIPKRVVSIEHIYYINQNGFVYKYQVWKKKVKPN